MVTEVSAVTFITSLQLRLRTQIGDAHSHISSTTMQSTCLWNIDRYANQSSSPSLILTYIQTGAVRMCDLRASALCEGLGQAFPTPSTHPTPTKNSLSEYMVGISDLSFDPCAGHLLAARDYGGVTVWDLRTNKQHLARYSILPTFRKKLMSHLYDRYVSVWVGWGEGWGGGKWTHLCMSDTK